MSENNDNIQNEEPEILIINPVIPRTRKPRAKKVITVPPMVTKRTTIEEQENWIDKQIHNEKEREKELMIQERINKALSEDRSRRTISPINKTKVLKEESESETDSEESEPEMTNKQLKEILLKLRKKKLLKDRKQAKALKVLSSDDDSEEEDNKVHVQRSSRPAPVMYNISDQFF